MLAEYVETGFIKGFEALCMKFGPTTIGAWAFLEAEIWSAINAPAIENACPYRLDRIDLAANREGSCCKLPIITNAHHAHSGLRIVDITQPSMAHDAWP